MTDQSYHVYVIQGRGQRDYSDCQAALAHVPARMTALPFLGTEDDSIASEWTLFLAYFSVAPTSPARCR